MDEYIVVSEGEYRVLKSIVESGFREGSIDEASHATGIDSEWGPAGGEAHQAA